MRRRSLNNGIFNSEDLPPPEFVPFSNNNSQSNAIYSSAAFIRDIKNNNIDIIISLGDEISPGTIWYSQNIYLDNNTFNITRPVTEVTYPNNKDMMILKKLTYQHDIFIQYKLSKNDGTNYTNRRELRCTIVKQDGITLYDSCFFANQQPETSQHDVIQLRGHIQHEINDIIKLKINIAQDNRNNDQSDSKLTIFRINWNILGLY